MNKHKGPPSPPWLACHSPGPTPPLALTDFNIEEGRAASKSPHQRFGYFISMSQPAVSADIISFQIQLLEYFPQIKKEQSISS
jgi:hypothetical protein